MFKQNQVVTHTKLKMKLHIFPKEKCYYNLKLPDGKAAVSGKKAKSKGKSCYIYPKIVGNFN